MCFILTLVFEKRLNFELIVFDNMQNIHQVLKPFFRGCILSDLYLSSFPSVSFFSLKSHLWHNFTEYRIYSDFPSFLNNTYTPSTFFLSSFVLQSGIPWRSSYHGLEILYCFTYPRTTSPCLAIVGIWNVSKDPCIKVLVPSLSLSGSDRNIWRWVQWEVFRTLVCLQRVLWRP